jgi:hypothetical protein
MTVATINRFIRLFADAFKALAAEVAVSDVERLAMLIQQSMDQGRRRYHVSTHVFDMCEGMNPRQVLATLFHDLVYYQLDGGFPPHTEAMLKRVVRVENRSDSLILRAIDRNDAGLVICAGLFGFKAGHKLPLYGGMNEFLSAVVSTRFLQPYLSPAELLAIAACIEATIPFRGADAKGNTASETLAQRVREVGNSLALGLGEADIVRIVTDAVLLANRDVSSFSEADPDTFLAHTWLLIEESNAPLAAVGVYSIQEYRSALSRMENFLGTLNPDHVFHHYRDTPGKAEFTALCNAARGNLEFTTRYLGTKIAAISVVEALAVATGGDCPVSMMLGDVRSPYGRPDRVEDFLPQPPTAPDVDPVLLDALEKSPGRESENDLTESPLTAFIYRSLGHAGAQRALVQAKRMFAGELPAREFLSGLDREMVRAVARACAEIALSRRDALLALEKAL